MNKIYFGAYYLDILKLKDINQNYLNWFHKEENTRYLKNSIYKNINSLKNYYLKERKKKNILLGIYLKKTNLHIGNIKYYKLNLKKKTALFGIFIGNKKYQNRKIGQKSIKVACNWLYKFHNVNKVFLYVDKKNIQAIKSYKKSGFKIFKRTKDSLGMVKKNCLSQPKNDN